MHVVSSFVLSLSLWLWLCYYSACSECSSNTLSMPDLVPHLRVLAPCWLSYFRHFRVAANFRVAGCHPKTEFRL